MKSDEFDVLAWHGERVSSLGVGKRPMGRGSGFGFASWEGTAFFCSDAKVLLEHRPKGTVMVRWVLARVRVNVASELLRL